MTVVGQITGVQHSVDQSIIKVSQSVTIIVMLLAFILDIWVLVAVVAVINIVGSIRSSLSLWRQLYLHVLKPSGLVKPRIIPDNPEPHRFAQGVGGALAAVSTVVLVSGFNVIGWVLGWLLIILAALNVFLGFCMGCFIYYQFNRLGVPGFTRSPINQTDSFPEYQALESDT